MSILDDKLYDVAIIGAGASGITTAIYCARAGLSVALIEKGLYGGQLLNTDTVENYTGFTSINARDLSNFMEEHVKSQDGVDHIYGNVKSVDKQSDVFNIALLRKTIQSKTLVIATGVKHKKLGAIGEEDYDGKGISYCAVCDGLFFKNKHVAVIGGGNSAVEAGIYLANIVDKVSLVYYKEKSKMRAEQYLLDKFDKLPNTAIIDKAETYEFNGNESLKAITYFDGHDNGKAKVLHVDGAFVYVGIEPTTKSFQNLNILDEEGFALTDSKMRTDVGGLCAIGDVRSESIRQVVSATGDGAIASDSIVNYLRNIQ